MISLHIVKKLRASAFQTVCTDRAEDLRTFRSEIIIEERVSEFPHPQSWPAHAVPYPGCVPNHTDGRGELMGLPAEILQLDASLRKIHGFIKPPVVTDENLVGADDRSSIMAFGNPARFCLGEPQRTFSRAAARGAQGFLDRSLVHRCGLDADGKARIG